MAKECEVCSGQGSYPIIDCFGVERYSITCPECFGSGNEDEPEAEDACHSPRSSAADIKSMDALREHVRKHWS